MWFMVCVDVVLMCLIGTLRECGRTGRDLRVDTVKLLQFPALRVV